MLGQSRIYIQRPEFIKKISPKISLWLYGLLKLYIRLDM